MMEANPPHDLPGSAPAARNPIWTPARHELMGWFKRNAPSLGELYEGAVCLLLESPIPGRFRFIAHAVREIRNSLPDVIVERSDRQQFDWKGRLDKLEDVWSRTVPPSGGLGTSITTPGPSLPSTSDLVPMPRRLFRMIESLLADHAAARLRRREAAERLYQKMRIA